MNKKFLSVVTIAALSFQSLPAFAESWDRGRREGRDRRWDYKYHSLPHGYVALALGGLTYLYYEGLFYRHSPRGYVFVQPPIGAVVPALPPGYTTVLVQQTPYYYYQNAYYVNAPNGYAVAAPPVVPQSVSAPSIPVQENLSVNKIDSYDIYIPNDNGSYTLVTLKKSDKGGFLGPQGEFYPEHPTVEQLKALYGHDKK